MSVPEGHIFPINTFVDLTIVQFGHQHCHSLHSYGPALRNYFLFHYIRSGKGELQSKNKEGQLKTYHLEAGQGFLIWPHQENTYIADKNRPWNYHWVEFYGLKASEILEQAGLSYNQPIFTPEPGTKVTEMENALTHIIENGKAPNFELIGHLFIFLSALAESNIHRRQRAGVGLREYYIREIISYIEAYYQEGITVSDIAEFCNMDKSHLGKIFKRIMGINLRDFLVQFRIGKACELMQNSHKSINEISAMVGYSNMFNFSRAFKTVRGESPRTWRDKNKLR